MKSNQLKYEEAIERNAKFRHDYEEAALKRFPNDPEAALAHANHLHGVRKNDTRYKFIDWKLPKPQKEVKSQTEDKVKSDVPKKPFKKGTKQTKGH